MNNDNADWKNDLDKTKVVQKCPRCNEMGLRYVSGKIKCYNCGFEQNVREI